MFVVGRLRFSSVDSALPTIESLGSENHQAQTSIRDSNLTGLGYGRDTGIFEISRVI